MKIAVTTDHTGLAYGNIYNELKNYLTSLGHDCVDFGPKSLDMADDYPDFMFPAARSVASGECEAGVIMGGSGQGEAMAANRIKGVRCALYYGPAVAMQPINAEGETSQNPFEILKLSRQHNLANMLSFSARFLTLEEMKQAVRVWLETPIGQEERHIRRAKKLDKGA